MFERDSVATAWHTNCTGFVHLYSGRLSIFRRWSLVRHFDHKITITMALNIYTHTHTLFWVIYTHCCASLCAMFVNANSCILFHRKMKGAHYSQPFKRLISFYFLVVLFVSELFILILCVLLYLCIWDAFFWFRCISLRLFSLFCCESSLHGEFGPNRRERERQRKREIENGTCV